MATPIATRTVWRIFRSLSDRPTVMIGGSVLKILDSRFLGRCDRCSFCGGPTWRGNQVAVSDDDFMDDSLHAVTLRRELALLDCPFDENVVAFLEGRRDARKVAIERQVVPIRVLLRLAIAVLVTVAFPKTDIRDGCSGRKISKCRLGYKIADDFETIPLHGYWPPCSR